MSNRRNGPIRRAAIRLLAEERRLPLAAAAQKYALMPIKAKAALCARVVRQVSPDPRLIDGQERVSIGNSTTWRMR